MLRHRLQHVILENRATLDLRDFYIVGSAAILAIADRPSDPSRPPATWT